MKKFLILVFFGYVLFNFFKEENSVETIQDSKPMVSYAFRGVDNSWPLLPETENQVAAQLDLKNYYLIFDGSGSMKESECSNNSSKLAVAKTAVTEFIKKIPANANIGFSVFDYSGASERVALATHSQANIITEIDGVRASGTTPLRTAIKDAFSALNQQAIKQLGYGEYHLIVITDGQASDNEDPTDMVQLMLEKSPVVLHTIGFCIDGSHSLNQTGLTLYKAANNPAELSSGLDAVLAESADFAVDSFDDTAVTGAMPE